MKCILDTNIYDKLAINVDIQTKIKNLIDRGRLTIIVTRTVVGHLSEGQFQKLEETIAVSRQYLEEKITRLQCRKAELNLDYYVKMLELLRNEDKEIVSTFRAEHMEDAFQYIISLKAVVGNSLISIQD